MEEKDICCEGQDDIEIMLAKSESLASSLGVALDQTISRADNFCNDFIGWLKASRFDIDEALIFPGKLEKFYTKSIDYREEKNSIKAKIYQLDEFIKLKQAALAQLNIKVTKTKVYVDKIEKLREEANTEIKKLKKQKEDEINELTNSLKINEDIVACLKGEKSCDDPSIQLSEESKELIKRGLSYSK